MRASRLVWLLGASLSLAAAGCGDADTADRVHDLRILAMRADPPEQELLLGPGIAAAPSDGGAGAPDAGLDLCSLLGQLGDAGLAFDAGCPPDADGGAPADAGAQAAPQTQPVTVTGLVVDPHGAGRAIHYTFATCARLDSTDRCSAATPAYQVLLEGELPAGATSNEVSVTFTPSPELLSLATQLDPYRGFGGLPLPVQLSVQAGGEAAVGYKLVVFTPRVGAAPVVPNTNPSLDGLQLNGQPWPADSEPALTAPDGGDPVLPLFATSSEETYTKPRFDLTSQVTLKEAWTFHFFATAGGFSQLQTGGGDDLVVTSVKALDSAWQPDKGQAAQDVTFWVVVRDGRGGENWLLRRAHYAP